MGRDDIYFFLKLIRKNNSIQNTLTCTLKIFYHTVGKKDGQIVKKIRPLIYVLASPLLFVATKQFCEKQTDGFALHKIASSTASLATDSPSKVKPEDLDKIKHILSQPYSYLASGNQCFVFASLDDQYVIKFFNHSRMRSIDWLGKIPLPSFLSSFQQKYTTDKIAKLHRHMSSYHMAFRYFKHDAGLCFFHLHGDDPLKQTVTLFDKIGCKHQIDIGDYDFIIQKKAEGFFPSLQKLIDEKKIDMIKTNIKETLDFFHRRSLLGIYDKDAILDKNFGFCRDRLMLIDVGSLRLDYKRMERKYFFEDIKTAVEPLKAWLETQDPSLSYYLDEEMKKL
jgi:hypothetical protein